MAAIVLAPRSREESRSLAPASRRSARWQNREVAIAPIPNVIPHHIEESLSSRAPVYQSEVNSFSTVYRQALAPGSEDALGCSWGSSPYYPGAGPEFEILGVTSIATSVISVGDLYFDGYKAYQHANEIGDKRGVEYSYMNGTAACVGIAYGPAVGAARVSTAAKILDPGNSLWIKMGDIAGPIFMWILSAIYGLAGVIDLKRGWDSSAFHRKVEKRIIPHERLAYLKQRLQADEATLLAKEIKKVRKLDPTLPEERIAACAKENIRKQGIDLAMKQQKGALKEQLKLMRELKVGGKGFTLNDKMLEAVVRRRFGGKGKCEEHLAAHGKNLLIENLRQKKLEKMTRVLGDTAVEQIATATDETALPAIEKAAQSKRRTYWARGAFYLVGAAITLAALYFTPGLGLAIIGLAMAAMYGIEFKWSLTKLLAQRNDASAPGRNDHRPVLASMWLNVAAIVGIALLTAYTSYLTLPMMLLGLIGHTIWCAINVTQCYFIEERRKKYIKGLLTKAYNATENRGERLNLREFAYICEYATDKQVNLDQLQMAFDALPSQDKEDLGNMASRLVPRRGKENRRIRVADERNRFLIAHRKLHTKRQKRFLQKELLPIIPKVQIEDPAD